MYMFRYFAILAVISAISFAICCGASAAGAVRGITPELLGRYQVSDTFTCLEDGAIIPASRINDDFCDCQDGTDEPGTSACKNGRFYCHNEGYVPAILASTFVDDGVCDCCDGSDEPVGGCNNICSVLGEEVRQQKQQELASYKAGAEARITLIQHAENKRQEWIQADAQLRAAIGQLEPIIDKLQAQRNLLEQEIAEMETPAEAASEPVDWKDPRDPDTWDLDEDDDAAYLHNEELYYPDALAQPGEVVDEEDSGIEETETVATTDAAAAEDDAEAEARRIAAQWTSDLTAATAPAAASVPDAASGIDEGDSRSCSGEGTCENSDVPPQAAVPVTTGDTAKTAGSSIPESGGILGSLRKVTSRLSTLIAGSSSSSDGDSAEIGEAGAGTEVPLDGKKAQLEKVTSTFDEYKQKADELRSQQTRVAAHLAQDHGPGHIFSYMAGQCYNKTVDKYTYRVCPNGRAHQIEDNSEVLLGTFSGYANDYSVMEFTKGATCWQGPARSVTVTLQCGLTTKLLAVDEPSRCTYAAVMSTPALCDSAAVDRIQAELDQLDGVHRDEL